MGEKQQSKGACVNSIAINTANNSLLETATVVLFRVPLPLLRSNVYEWEWDGARKRLYFMYLFDFHIFGLITWNKLEFKREFPLKTLLIFRRKKRVTHEKFNRVAIEKRSRHVSLQELRLYCVWCGLALMICIAFSQIFYSLFSI